MDSKLRQKLDAWYDKDYRMTFYERIRYTAESEHLFKDLCPALRYARTFEYIIDRLELPIDDGILIGAIKERIPDENEYRTAEKMMNDWWDKPLEEIQKDAVFYYTPAWLRRRTPWFYALGHLALQWEDMIYKGLEFFSERARKSRNIFEANGDIEKAEFACAAEICSLALQRYILRYAHRCDTAGRYDDATSLRHIAKSPARSFKEALQLIWLVELPLMKIAGCGVFNFGRMDQYLMPLYERDVTQDRLTRNGALKLIEEFYFKNIEFMSPTDHMSQDKESTLYTLDLSYDDSHYIILGGIDANGTGHITELSHLFIEAAAELRTRDPLIVVRWYPQIDKEFFKKVVDAMRANATIILYNDKTMIPALQRYGVAYEDAVEYGFYGCNDPSIPHKEGGLRQTWFNLLRPIELALNGGDYPLAPRAENPDIAARECVYPLSDRLVGIMNGPYYGAPTPLPDTMRTFEDFLDAYRTQVQFLVSEFRKGFEMDFLLEREYCRNRFRMEDAFIEGPVETGTPWILGGTRYHHVLMQGGGMASAVNSLYAIDKLVFRDKRYTLSQMSEILASNFERDMNLYYDLNYAVEKYGNDNPEVDRYARIVVDIFCDAIEKANTGGYLYTILPTLSTDRDHTTQGLGVGATPDGRMAGEPISENQSPSSGTDTHGLTALLNSTTNIDFTRLTGGPLNMRIHPSAVRGVRGLNALVQALETYFMKGGMQAQINVVDTETLRAAQKNPQFYKDLCVRVTGYSAYFVQMSKTAQEEIILRSEIH